MLFNGPDNPKIFPYPWGSLPNSTHGFIIELRASESPIQMVSQWIKLFCRAHECDQHTLRSQNTHTQTDAASSYCCDAA